MKIEILLFGITADIVGGRALELEIESGSTIQSLRQILANNYPKLSNYKNYSVALNMEYATDEIEINKGDSIALIPPVSGG